MRNMAAYSITKNLLCFICHGKPDKSQEDFDCGCYRPGNSFLCENDCASQQNMLEHILKGTGNTVVDKQNRRCTHPATMERV